VKSIAIFNNKGGVGKTTFLCNLAGYLSKEESKKILVVDADPQCNLTQSVFSDDALPGIYRKEGFTILTLIKPLVQGKGFFDELRPAESERFSFDIVPGDPGMSLQEDKLATDWVQAISGDIRGLRTTFLFSDFLQRCKDYDYVFFDMGPSLGSINRSVLVAADFFLTPMSTDIFSLKAIGNISVALSEWRKKLERALEDVADNLDDLEIAEPGWKLQFLGFLTQQYTAKAVRGKRQPVKAFDQIAQKIPVQIDRNLVKKFVSNPSPELNFNLGSIPTLHSLVPLSQINRAPIFDLKASDGVVGAHFTKVKEYKKIIGEISARFMTQVERLS